MVKDSFIGLEDLWKKLMVSQHSKMKFLKELANSKDFESFYQTLGKELEGLVDYNSKHSKLIDLLASRDKAKQEFYDLCIFYRNINQIREFLGSDHTKNCIFTLKKTGKQILSYMQTIGGSTGQKWNVQSESLKYYGIGVDVIAKLDLWEIDYIF